MNKKHIKIIIIAVLSFVVTFEIGYIIKTNIINDPIEQIAETISTPTPLPIVSGENSVEASKSGEARIIVLDPGHGKPSAIMTDAEKQKSGWIKNNAGQWGEWRHFKTGSSTVNCEGAGCNGSGECWYPIENGDRNAEPEINLKNALAAQKYLEDMGYTVRLTRTTNDENPSITTRLSYCYPDRDATKAPEAEAYISIHSNAAGKGSRGTAYIKAEGGYDQAWIDKDYAKDSNKLGALCNKYVAEMTALELYSNGEITWKPELVSLCKAPVPCGYLEIGFFDNASDLEILNTETENIGRAIAKGVDEFCKTH